MTPLHPRERSVERIARTFRVPYWLVSGDPKPTWYRRPIWRARVLWWEFREWLLHLIYGKGS